MEISTETVLDAQQVMGSKLDKILEVVQTKQPLLASDGIAATATENIGKCPKEIAQVTEKIKISYSGSGIKKSTGSPDDTHRSCR